MAVIPKDTHPAIQGRRILMELLTGVRQMNSTVKDAGPFVEHASKAQLLLLLRVAKRLLLIIRFMWKKVRPIGENIGSMAISMASNDNSATIRVI